MGIWADYFHVRTLFRWDVFSWIIATLLAIGGIVLVFDQFVAASICFGISGTLLIGRVVYGGINHSDSVKQRVFFILTGSIVLLAITVGSICGTMSFARKKRDEQRPQAAQKSPEQKSPESNCPPGQFQSAPPYGPCTATETRSQTASKPALQQSYSALGPHRSPSKPHITQSAPVVPVSSGPQMSTALGPDKDELLDKAGKELQNCTEFLKASSQRKDRFGHLLDFEGNLSRARRAGEPPDRVNSIEASLVFEQRRFEHQEIGIWNQSYGNEFQAVFIKLLARLPPPSGPPEVSYEGDLQPPTTLAGIKDECGRLHDLIPKYAASLPGHGAALHRD
jgi:hypothetical protein